MSRKPASKRTRPKPKTVLRLPDLDQAKSAVLNSLTGEQEPHGFDEFYSSVDVVVIGRNTFEVVLTFGTWPYGKKPVVILSGRPIDLSSIEGGVVVTAKELAELFQVSPRAPSQQMVRAEDQVPRGGAEKESTNGSRADNCGGVAGAYVFETHTPGQDWRGGCIYKGSAKPDDPIYKDASWTVTSLRRPARLAGKLWGQPMKKKSGDAAARARVDDKDERDAEMHRIE